MKKIPSPITLDVLERTKRVGARQSPLHGGGSSYMDKLKYTSPILPQNNQAPGATYLVTENNAYLITEDNNNIIK
jgi:hypothetical protein